MTQIFGKQEKLRVSRLRPKWRSKSEGDDGSCQLSPTQKNRTRNCQKREKPPRTHYCSSQRLRSGNSANSCHFRLRLFLLLESSCVRSGHLCSSPPLPMWFGSWQCHCVQMGTMAFDFKHEKSFIDHFHFFLFHL